MIDSGTSFWISNEIHLHFVLSDPRLDDQHVLYVNVTSFDAHAPNEAENDRACIIQAGEHRFITHTSCVYYFGAHEASVYYLEQKHARNELRFDEPANSQLLDKMRQCAGDSLYMEADYYDILVRQGLV